MATILADNISVEAALRKLERQALELGAELDPETRICSRNGQLCIESGAKLDSKRVLVRLPEQSLLPLGEVELALSGDDLCLASHKPQLTKARRELWETMLELYNLTNKIAWHRATSPWTAFADRLDILTRIVQARAATPIVSKFLDHLKDGDREHLTVESFLKTRALGFKGHGAQRATPVLMPIVDFLNHHPRGAGFGNKQGADILVLAARPVEGLEECFARYGMYDAHDTYLVYGFVDASAVTVRSVPFDLELDNLGTIRVESRFATPFKGNLPPELTHLRRIMPKVTKVRENLLAVSHLMIPDGQSRMPLRQVLLGLINTLRAGLPQDVKHRLLLEAEQSVLAENVRHYEELAQFLDGVSAISHAGQAIASARELARIQLEKLHKYQQLSD